MQLFRKLLIRVRLDAQGLADGEHLEQEGQVVQVPSTQQLWVLPEVLAEGLAAAC